MILGIFFIDRIVNFIPTFSGKYYEVINITNVVIIFCIFILISSAGFRERTSILLHRFDKWFVVDDWIVEKLGYTPRPFNLYIDDESGEDVKEMNKGKANAPSGNNKNGKSSGKAANNQSSHQSTVNPQISQQYAVPAPLPVQGPSMPNYGGGSSSMMQPSQNFNSMYANTSTPLVGASTPGMDDMFMEPEAANGALGSSSWSSW